MVRAIDVWMPWQLEFLQNNYLTISHAEIARVVNKSENAVRGKAWELGFRKKALKYSEDEKQSINKSYEAGIRLSVIAEILGRPKTGVCTEARKMGLTDMHHPKSPLTTTEVDRRRFAGRERIRKYGHPRGSRVMLTCPVCGKFFDVKQSAGQVFCSVQCANKVKVQNKLNYSRGAGGKREDLGGQYFRSSYEANYARYLNLLMAHGEPIVKWEFEAETFEFKKIKRGTRFYTPDFKVTFTDGHVEYHEVKGWDYARGKTARKRMAKYFPHVKLVLIDADFFKAVKRKGHDKLISGWE